MANENGRELHLNPMKAKRKPRRAKTLVGSSSGAWWEDLPVSFQVELLDRLRQAKRGEDLQDFDEALAEAEKMTDQMLAASTHGSRRPAK